MKTKAIYLIILLMVLVLIVGMVVARPKVPTDPCPIKSDTNVVIYGDTGFGGVGSLSKSWITHFMDWWKSYDSSINYVFLDDNDLKSDCMLSNYPNIKVYIQPGGNAYYMQNSLSSSGKNNIKNYINSKRGYVGICAGFYYTAGDYIWQGDYYDWPDLLGLYPTVEGSIIDIADYEGNPDYALTGLSSGYNMIYYGGPTRGWKDTPSDFPGEALLTYTDISGDLPAAIIDGNKLLMSVHAEAYENDGITGLTTEQRIANYNWFANSINSVSGAGFYVPVPLKPECNDGIDNDEDGFIDLVDSGCLDSEDSDETNCGDLVCEGDEDFQSCLIDCIAPECSDGLDNDNDGLIDFSIDPGCGDIFDNDETDYTGPVEIISDGFEDGNLNGWLLYGSGRPWAASTDTAFEGLWSAKAGYTGAGDDSFIETEIGSCSNDMTFEYYRKLVGLDAADDFEVSYFNGNWISVEHLGSSSASDSSFKFKSFSIPAGSSKIRFKCECGAVLEKCYLDNVKVIC